jgi:hypothetical protein
MKGIIAITATTEPIRALRRADSVADRVGLVSREKPFGLFTLAAAEMFQ